MAAAWDAGYMAGLTGAPRWAPDIYDGMADRAWRAGWTFATSGGFCLA